jgi:hypothetical protein
MHKNKHDFQSTQRTFNNTFAEVIVEYGEKYLPLLLTNIKLTCFPVITSLISFLQVFNSIKNKYIIRGI